MMVHMLTTADNPYNPLLQFDEWKNWDESNGYHTTAYLARVVHTSHDLSEVDQENAIDEAIDLIVTENVNGMYRKVSFSV